MGESPIKAGISKRTVRLRVEVRLALSLVGPERHLTTTTSRIVEKVKGRMMDVILQHDSVSAEPQHLYPRHVKKIVLCRC